MISLKGVSKNVLHNCYNVKKETMSPMMKNYEDKPDQLKENLILTKPLTFAWIQKCHQIKTYHVKINSLPRDRENYCLGSSVKLMRKVTNQKYSGFLQCQILSDQYIYWEICSKLKFLNEVKITCSNIFHPHIRHVSIKARLEGQRQAESSLSTLTNLSVCFNGWEV